MLNLSPSVGKGTRAEPSRTASRPAAR